MPREKKKTARLRLTIANVVDPVASVALMELDRRTERALSLCEQIVREERLAHGVGLLDFVKVMRGDVDDLNRRLQNVEAAMVKSRAIASPRGFPQ